MKPVHLGDVNQDGSVNVLDVVLISDMIKNGQISNVIADVNQDGNVDVMDIVKLIESITNNKQTELIYFNCAERAIKVDNYIPSLPDVFQYNISIFRNIYWVRKAYKDGVELKRDDWIGIFSPSGACCGARMYGTAGLGYCDMVAMGEDAGGIEENPVDMLGWTEGYFKEGDVPEFKLFEKETGEIYDLNMHILLEAPEMAPAGYHSMQYTGNCKFLPSRDIWIELHF